jgi:polyisoprenoid-binding protein YceI
MKKIPLFARTKWIIETSHSNIGFKVKHLKFANISGIFKEFDASIYTKGDDFLTAQVDFWLNPGSIDTGDSNRDIRLRSSDFLHVDKFKVIHFCASNYMKAESDGRYEMHGDLSIVGFTKAIKLDVEFGGVIKDAFGNDKSTFNVTGGIKRKDWGLNWNAGLESGGVLVSDDVWIECNIDLIKQV